MSLFFCWWVCCGSAPGWCLLDWGTHLPLLCGSRCLGVFRPCLAGPFDLAWGCWQWCWPWSGLLIGRRRPFLWIVHVPSFWTFRDFAVTITLTHTWGHFADLGDLRTWGLGWSYTTVVPLSFVFPREGWWRWEWDWDVTLGFPLPAVVIQPACPMLGGGGGCRYMLPGDTWAGRMNIPPAVTAAGSTVTSSHLALICGEQCG